MIHIKLFEEHSNEFTFNYLDILKYYFSKYFIEPEKATEIMKNILMNKKVRIDYESKPKDSKIYDVKIERMGNSTWPLYTTVLTMADTLMGYGMAGVGMEYKWELPSHSIITVYDPDEFSEETKKMFKEIGSNKTGSKFDL